MMVPSIANGWMDVGPLSLRQVSSISLHTRIRIGKSQKKFPNAPKFGSTEIKMIHLRHLTERNIDTLETMSAGRKIFCLSRSKDNEKE